MSNFRQVAIPVATSIVLMPDSPEKQKSNSHLADKVVSAPLAGLGRITRKSPIRGRK
jgi:hypothetical protein